MYVFGQPLGERGEIAHIIAGGNFSDEVVTNYGEFLLDEMSAEAEIPKLHNRKFAWRISWHVEAWLLLYKWSSKPMFGNNYTVSLSFQIFPGPTCDWSCQAQRSPRDRGACMTDDEGKYTYRADVIPDLWHFREELKSECAGDDSKGAERGRSNSSSVTV